MSDAISCSSCAAKLAVPVGAAGKALRCPRCGTHTSVPATPPPAPPPRVRPTVVREKPEPEEDDPPPRRRDRDEDDRDDEPRPRRRRRREKVVVPGWVWTVGVPLIGMLIGVPLVVTRGKRDGRDTVQIRIPASEPQAPPWQPQAPPNAIVVKPTIVWVKRTHEASGTTWEFPSMGGRWIDHRASAIDVNGQPVEFSVDIEAIRPEMNRYTQVQMAQLGESYWVSKTVEKIDLFEGRPRLLGRDQSGCSWHVADPNWYYRFGVFNPNADVGGERVKRFLESIRITRAPPPGTRLGEEIPFGWDRVTVSVGIQSEMSALMPQGSPPEWVKRREGDRKSVV